MKAAALGRAERWGSASAFCDTVAAQMNQTKGTCSIRKVNWGQNSVGPTHQPEKFISR